jgi:hypothetical protein
MVLLHSSSTKSSSCIRGKLDNQQLAAWKQILASDVPAFNEQVGRTDIPVLYVSTASDE